VKKKVYTAARKSRFLFTPFTLVIIFLPVILLFGCMIWGHGFFLPFWCVAAAALILGYALYRLAVTGRRKNMGDEAVLARWTYSREYWRDYQKSAFRPGWKAVVTQIVLCALLFLLFLVLPRAYVIVPWTRTVSIVSFADARLDAVVLIILVIWLYSLIKKWLPMRYPGEVILVWGGIYTRYSLIKWRGKSVEFDGAVLEKSEGASSVVVHYRLKTGTVSRTQIVELTIPVPPEMSAEAETAVKRLNAAQR
jgi:hypothetical protein